MTEAVLIGFDWGTTNLRAALLDASGNVLEQRVGPSGVGRISPDDFAARFDEHVSGWPAVPALLAGMVGSAQGWRDAGYAPAPTRVADLGEALRTFEHDGRTVAIVPGVNQGADGEGAPDVMRGEETQIAGLLERRPHFQGTVVMPGTHSKWVRVAGGAIRSFSTYMTGDLFEAVGRHTILRHSVAESGTAQGAFETAFASAFGRDGEQGRSVWGQLFAIRAATILYGAGGAEGRDKLSGFLVGAEFAAARADGYLQDDDEDRLTLIGSGALVERYRQACAIAKIENVAYQGTPLVWPALVALARQKSLL